MKKKTPVIMHQHVDASGRPFGAPHPADASHSNPKTQERHDFTVRFLSAREVRQ